MKETSMNQKHNSYSVPKGAQMDTRYFDPLFGERGHPGSTMPLNEHRVCGILLHKVLCAVEGRRGASEPVRFVINTLDSWVGKEFPNDQLSSEGFVEPYCPGPRVKPDVPLNLSELIIRLDRVKSILVDHYPSRAALKALLKEIDQAIASISKWDGKPRGKVYREPVPRS
jgi:hypothetical protein